MAQKTKSKSSSTTTTEEAPVESKKSDTADAVKAGADAVMDKIDDILGEFNAEEFVKSFVQKGGQ